MLHLGRRSPGKVWSGVQVATMMRSMSASQLIPAASSALRAASAPSVAVVSSGPAMWRNLMPVRSVIHSSEVSTLRSQFVVGNAALWQRGSRSL
jgi:hypothetical protein